MAGSRQPARACPHFGCSRGGVPFTSDLVESGGMLSSKSHRSREQSLADGAVKVAHDNPLLWYNSESHARGRSRARSHRGFEKSIERLTPIFRDSHNLLGEILAATGDLENAPAKEFLLRFADQSRLCGFAREFRPSAGC